MNIFFALTEYTVSPFTILFAFSSFIPLYSNFLQHTLHPHHNSYFADNSLCARTNSDRTQSTWLCWRYPSHLPARLGRGQWFKGTVSRDFLPSVFLLINIFQACQWYSGTVKSTPRCRQHRGENKNMSSKKKFQNKNLFPGTSS